MGGLRITTWNVNGIRNPFAYQPWSGNRSFQFMFDTLEADIVVMQETKIQRKDLQDDMVLIPGWDVFFSLPKYKKGYSGVAIYTRNSACCPIRAEEGITGVLCPPNSSTKFRDLPIEQRIGGYPDPSQISGAVDELALDSEGRCVILEFPAFVLIGVYCPATRDATRTEFRECFLNALDMRVRNLVSAGKEVFLCGDLNIIRSELDTAGVQDMLRKEAMTLDDFISTPPRRMLNQMIFGGRVIGERDPHRNSPVLWDLCREFHPSRQGMYTCWDTKKNARPGNFGSRIDYVLCSSGMRDWITHSDIQEGLMGSDHCPVFAVLAEKVSFQGKDIHIADLMNPKGMFEDGERARQWEVKDLLPMSAKLIPEFDRRRSIRDMFFQKPFPPSDSNSSPQSLVSPSIVSHPDTQAAQNDEGDLPPFPTNISGSASKHRIASQGASLSHLPVSGLSSSVADSVIPEGRANKRFLVTPTEAFGPKKKRRGVETKTGARQSPDPAGFSQSSLTRFLKPQTQNSGPKDDERPGMLLALRNMEMPGRDETTNIQLLSDGSSQQERIDSSDKIVSRSPSLKRGLDVIDNSKSKESWSKILGKRVPPECEHREHCQSLVTKKPGVNCGRSFYMCARPLGPSGDKEQGTEFRCRTFIWSSDWNGKE